MANETTPMSEEALAGLSDEEIMNLGPEAFGEFGDGSAEDAAPAEDDPQDPEADGPGEEATDEDLADGEPDDAGADDESAASDEPAADEADEAEQEDSVDGEEDAEEGDEKEKDEAEEVDYQAEYQALLAPFRANGKDMKVDSVEDARTLMQMGANYNKKMAALKPNLKLLKLLENNQLLDQEKLSYLIDLEQKKPEAIQKLIKDSGLDPLDIDTEKESEYKPETYTVDDRELELDSVLDDIQDTPTYSKTINLVSNKWDGQSKQVVAEQPQLLKVINDHMASGVYDRISTEMEQQRMLGRLTGLSDLDAYRKVGDEIQARGGFADLFEQQAPGAQPAKKTVVAKPKAEDARRKSKKRAASSTRTSPSQSKGPIDFNPLALSDEDFEKLGDPKLM